MSDDVRLDKEFSPLVTPEPVEGIAAEVAFVVPASAYDAIATEDDHAQPLELAAADEGPAAPMLEAIVALGRSKGSRWRLKMNSGVVDPGNRPQVLP